MNSHLQAAGLPAGPGLDTVNIGAFEGRESFAPVAHRKRIILRKGLARLIEGFIFPKPRLPRSNAVS
jgi:hypothetical protein